MQCATASDVNKARSFKPLYLTVQGCAGSGKSFFIKCLVNTVREVLGEKNVIHVVGPTGAASDREQHGQWEDRQCTESLE